LLFPSASDRWFPLSRLPVAFGFPFGRRFSIQKTNKNQQGQGKTGFYLFCKTPCFCWFLFVFIGF